MNLNLKAGLAVAVIAAILVAAVGIAIEETKQYVVYPERIDLQDDSARTAFEIGEDLRRLHADLMKGDAALRRIPVLTGFRIGSAGARR